MQAESSGVMRPLTNSYKNKEIGKFTVCCGGTLVIPAGWCGSLIAWFLILVPSFLQIIFINSAFEAAVPIDCAYICTLALSLTFLFMTTFTDPGIIPRVNPDIERQELRSMFEATDENVEVDHIAIVKNEEIVCMKCRTCNIYKPPRSFHCSDCQACIEVHDHHCPWVGTCVGKRNHRWFLCFGIFTMIHALFTFIVDILYLVKFVDFSDKADNDPLKVVCMVLLVFTSTIVCCVGGLSCYHSRLACLGATTNEELRGKYGK